MRNASMGLLFLHVRQTLCAPSRWITRAPPRMVGAWKTVVGEVTRTASARSGASSSDPAAWALCVDTQASSRSGDTFRGYPSGSLPSVFRCNSVPGTAWPSESSSPHHPLLTSRAVSGQMPGLVTTVQTNPTQESTNELLHPPSPISAPWVAISAGVVGRGSLGRIGFRRDRVGRHSPDSKCGPLRIGREIDNSLECQEQAADAFGVANADRLEVSNGAERTH